MIIISLHKMHLSMGNETENSFCTSNPKSCSDYQRTRELLIHCKVNHRSESCIVFKLLLHYFHPISAQNDRLLPNFAFPFVTLPLIKPLPFAFHFVSFGSTLLEHFSLSISSSLFNFYSKLHSISFGIECHQVIYYLVNVLIIVTLFFHLPVVLFNACLMVVNLN